jgi:hypothetical protein
LQEPPEPPHVLSPVPSTQVLVVVASQQPPLQVSPPAHELEHRPVPSHAFWTGQSPAAEQPHLPPPVTARQRWPFPLDGQLAHEVPLAPHAIRPVPATHMLVVSQQPPLQVSPPAHELVHTFEPLHAVLTGQSADVLQPHTIVERQTWPFAAFEQSTQAMPDAPQALLAVPLAQVPPLQQAPLHGELDEQAVVHWCEVVLQALPAGQSLAELQPHAPPPVTALHRWPMLDDEQSMQAPPFEPQPPELLVPGAQLPARQQPPLQGADDEQLDLQVCDDGSHAVDVGQSALVEQPHAPALQMWPLELVVQSTHEVPQQVGS